jgi:hypothetical protein
LFSDGFELPQNGRQTLFVNGSLIINAASKLQDEVNYKTPKKLDHFIDAEKYSYFVKWSSFWVRAVAINNEEMFPGLLHLHGQQRA